MKICDITQSYTPRSGGIKTYLHEKINFINRTGEDEHILIIPGEEDRIDQRENSVRYTVESIPIPGCEPYRFILNLKKVLSLFNKEKPDIIEFGSAYLLPYAGFLHRKKYPCKLVGFYHTDFPKAYVEIPLKNHVNSTILKKMISLTENYAKFIYNRFDMTVSSTTRIYDKLRRIGIEKIKNVSLGIDSELFHPAKRNVEFRNSLGIQNGDKLLIYSGRLDNEKRIDLILKAFVMISDNLNARLLFVGDGPLRGLTEEYCRKNDKIKLMPYENDRENLAMMLASSDIYITAGPYETFGLSVLEAQACGLPVLGVRSGALLERVDDTTGVLCQVDSVMDMAMNILNLSYNGHVAKGLNARKLVESNYSWEKTFTDLYSIYKKLLNEEE